MVRRVVFGLIVFTLLAFLALWVLSGGPQKIVRAIGESIWGLSNPFALADPNTQAFRLPWQPEFPIATINVEPGSSLNVDVPYEDPTSYSGMQERQALAELEYEYDRLSKQISDERTYGTPSPFSGMVRIAANTFGLQETDRQAEHLTLTANYTNQGAVDMTGWSLESALTRARLYLPRAASPYLTNTTNTLGVVYLEPGASALVTSGSSPLGVSFRENMCTGYLQQFQSFTPPLYESCPAPTTVLPLTPDNMQRYGDACFDVLPTLPNCQFPQSLPGNISTACRNLLSNELSHNGCVAANRFRSAFHSNIWRLYLNSPTEVWRNSHDAIRLLDANGKTVDVLVY